MDRTKLEHRAVDMRAIGEDDAMIIEGYAIVFDQSATHGEFTEIIHRGALDNTDMSNVPLRYNHNNITTVMARTKNGSLTLEVDDIGLHIVAELIDTVSNRDLYKSIKAGLIDKMSFAFTVSEDGDKWQFSEHGTIREINNIDKLYDVSVVDAPFYEGTSLYARSLELLDDNKRKVDALREKEILKEKITMKGKM